MSTAGAEDNDATAFLERVLDRVSGLNAIAVYDRDAVLIAKASRSEGDVGADASLAAVFAVLSEQASKLQFGKNKHITGFYKEKIVVHINCLPLVVSVVGSSSANIGLLLALQQDLRTALEPLRQVVEKAAESNSF